MKPNRLLVALSCAYLILAAYLAYMQIGRADYYISLSEKNRIRILYLEAPRGRILDRRGDPMATSRLSFNCSVVPHEAKKTIAQSCLIVAGILNEDPKELEERYYKRKPGAFNTVLLAEDIDPEKAMRIEERIDDLPGFMIETRPQREYMHGESVAHLVGYIGPMIQDELDSLDSYGYRRADWIGREGIEKSYESYLRGQSGGLQIEVDNRGRLVKVMGVKEPEDGKDIQLTIDSRLQAFAQELLKDQKGAVIVMDLNDGGILSINSAPSFDPNLFASTRGRRDVGKYLKGRQSPMVNRGLRGQYPPGSIFKIVTTLAAMEQKKVNLFSSFTCQGYWAIGNRRFKCWKTEGHGPQILTEAIAHSCDVFFYRTGLLAGADAIAQMALRFGLGLPTGIDLPEERKGFVPTKEWKKRTRHEVWYEGETANFAIGQGYLQMTPIQALTMAAGIATGGELLKPHVIDKISGVTVAERHAKSLSLAKKYVDAVKEGMDQAVNSDTGTGRLARVKGLGIAGKTGTAQSGQEEDHAWFVGYAPKNHPRYATVVFIEHGGHGGVAAAKVAGALFGWLKENTYL